MVRKKGWVLTSEAPARAPRRRFSSLMRSLRMRDLQRLGWGVSWIVVEGRKGWIRDLLGNLGVSGPFREGDVVAQDVGEGCVAVLALEGRGAV